MNNHFQNKTAVITGGASGIGLALAERLLSLRARSVIIADIHAGNLLRESQRLEAAFPGKVLGVRTDVTQPGEIHQMIQQAADFGQGRIDFLFNNAGIGLGKAFDDTTDADWAFAFNVNFYGALHGIRAVLPIMRAQSGGGHILNTASGAGYSHMPYQSMYSASKAALIALTGSLRYELWDDNIRLSVIIPGTVATPMWQNQAPPDALTPQESAAAILEGAAENRRLIIVTQTDIEGIANSTRLEVAEGFDQYFINLTRQRRSGIFNNF